MTRDLFGFCLALAACSRPDPGRSQTPPAPVTPPAPATSARSTFAERSQERERLAAIVAQRGIQDEPVLRALRKVPRHAFVPASWAAEAYQDRPLPIGHGQTISQPTVVAAMTQAAQPRAGDKCLEIGTGSGYQAAILAELCSQVFSIEYLAPLAQQAEGTLRALGYGRERVALRSGDGYVGWPEAAPFQVVLVTAAPEHVPRPLLDQLALGGRLVIPVGRQHEGQELLLYRRVKNGSAADSFTTQQLMAVRFVPFLGDAARGAP